MLLLEVGRVQRLRRPRRHLALSALPPTRPLRSTTYCEWSRWTRLAALTSLVGLLVGIPVALQDHSTTQRLATRALGRLATRARTVRLNSGVEVRLRPDGF